MGGISKYYYATESEAAMRMSVPASGIKAEKSSVAGKIVGREEAGGFAVEGAGCFQRR